MKNIENRRSPISERQPIPYVKVMTPKKGKGKKNDRSRIKAGLRNYQTGKKEAFI